MNADRFVRRVLWVAAGCNLAAAFLFAFPASPLGQMAGLPVSVPALYAALVALFVALFGVAYAWLAQQPRIDRPLVALAACGKCGAVAVVFASWLWGATSARAVAVISGDLVFAAIFFWWLRRTPVPAFAPLRQHGG